jgi:hypothetical protein
MAEVDAAFGEQVALAQTILLTLPPSAFALTALVAAI